MKEHKNGSGDISMIREILIGPQFSEYERRLQELLAQVKQNEKESNKKLKRLAEQMTAKEEQMDTKLEQFKEEIMRRYTDLEQLILSNTKSSESTMEQSILQERRDIGKLFADISNQLLNK